MKIRRFFDKPVFHLGLLLALSLVLTLTLLVWPDRIIFSVREW